MATNSITNVTMPAFIDNTKTADAANTVATDYNRGSVNDGTTTFDVFGACTNHYAKNTIYNHLVSSNNIPKEILSTSELISADDINSLKNILNAVITKWKLTDGLTSITKTKTHISDNDALDASTTIIKTTATVNTVANLSEWSNVVDKLSIFNTKLGLSSLSLPSTDMKIKKDDYNKWVRALIKVTQDCKCNSDCACNAVCTCNFNCGCNYSDINLKDNIEVIKPGLIDYINPIKFKYKLPDNAKVDNRTYHYGIEAQSLLNSEIKDSGALKKDQTGFYKVDYQELIGILIAEVQNLKNEIAILKGK